MIKTIEYVSIMLWVIYYYMAIGREVKKKNKFTLKALVKNPFKFIHSASLIFLIVYLLYQNYIREEVIPFVYFIIILTNVVYLGYDIHDNYQRKLNKREFYRVLLSLLLVGIVCIYILINGNILVALVLTLIIDVFIPLVGSLLNKYIGD